MTKLDFSNFGFRDFAVFQRRIPALFQLFFSGFFQETLLEKSIFFHFFLENFSGFFKEILLEKSIFFPDILAEIFQ